jgi:hypothetical protein
MSDYTKRLIAEEEAKKSAIGYMPSIGELYKGTGTSNPFLDYAMKDWQKGLQSYSSMMNQSLAPLQQQMQAYQSGGSYGQGQRQQAQENVAGGVANDMAQGVASGMTGTNIARGLQTRAGSELSKLYGNIEDTRNQLLNQATGNYASTYANMMGNYAGLLGKRPTWGK